MINISIELWSCSYFSISQNKISKQIQLKARMVSFGSISDCPNTMGKESVAEPFITHGRVGQKLFIKRLKECEARLKPGPLKLYPTVIYVCPLALTTY